MGGYIVFVTCGQCQRRHADHFHDRGQSLNRSTFDSPNSWFTGLWNQARFVETLSTQQHRHLNRRLMTAIWPNDIMNELSGLSQLAEPVLHLVEEATAALPLYLSLLWTRVSHLSIPLRFQTLGLHVRLRPTRISHLTVSLLCRHTTYDGVIL
jgi:hypothetical protein